DRRHAARRLCRHAEKSRRAEEAPRGRKRARRRPDRDPARDPLGLLLRSERHSPRSLLPAGGGRAAAGDPLGRAAARDRAARARQHRRGVGRGYNRDGEVHMSAHPPAAASGEETTVVLSGNFNPDARSVPMGNGWDWIADGWTIFRKAAGTWIGMVVVLVLISIAAHLIPL